MSFSLYDAVVPSNLQILGAVAAIVDKAESWCAENGHEADKVIGARLADDMLPFAYQVKSTAFHSAGALEGAREGLFSPDFTPPPGDFAGLKARLAEAIAALEAVTPDEVNALADREVVFAIGDIRMPFTGANFLLSFSQPNFYFHATTAYDLVRMLGVPVGKRDFLGRMRLTR